MRGRLILAGLASAFCGKCVSKQAMQVLQCASARLRAQKEKHAIKELKQYRNKLSSRHLCVSPHKPTCPFHLLLLLLLLLLIKNVRQTSTHTHTSLSPAVAAAVGPRKCTLLLKNVSCITQAHIHTSTHPHTLLSPAVAAAAGPVVVHAAPPAAACAAVAGSACAVPAAAAACARLQT